MLPFLKLKQSPVAGLIIKKRNPDHKAEGGEVEDKSHEECARAILSAIKADDASALSNALYAAFSLMDSDSNQENEQSNSHSYDAQNEKAGQEQE